MRKFFIKRAVIFSILAFAGLLVAYNCTKEYYFKGEQLEVVDLLPGDDNCPYGGTMLITFFDDNDNGVYDTGEETDVAYTCNGRPGRDGRIPLFDRNPAEGGQELLIGFDYNGNGQFDEDEVVMRIFIPDGQDGQDGQDALPFVLDANRMEFLEECGRGGIVFTYGYDSNGEPGLQEDEVLGREVLCDGAPGADGADGSDGSDGSDGQDGADGVNCWDLNGDGVDDPEEDQNGDGVWDAKDCQEEESFIVYEIIVDPPSCEKGGVRVDVYDDMDQNGELDKNVDFFMESIVLCYGATEAEAVAAGDRLTQYLDVLLVVEPGNSVCPEAPTAETIKVYLEGELLVTLAKCPIDPPTTTN